MKQIFLALLCCVAGASLAFGQQERLKGYTTVRPATRIAPSNSHAAKLAPVIAVSPLLPNKSFNYTITASAGLGAGVFSGTILGRNPLNRGMTTTTIPTQIVPLVITINDGSTTVTYDPTAPDTCVTGNPTDISIITGSPIFNNHPWTMNGVNVGNTQYIDAFQRAQFLSRLGGAATGYHLILSPSLLGAQTISFGPGHGLNFPATDFVGGTCGFIGIVNIDEFDAAVQNLILNPLAPGVNAGTFPTFFTKDVVESTSGIDLNFCCVLGYHSGIPGGLGGFQIYSPFSIDTTGVFGSGFTNTISHEMAEAVNDPTTVNATPPWGNEGQTVGLCQNNLEVGDPLSPGFGTSTNPFIVVGGNGLTYSLQELAYYSWFFGSTSLGVGAGGKFSNNGTFTGSAIICPPGGSNP